VTTRPEPRILLLAETYHPVLGGGEKQTHALARGLVNLGFSVDVVTRRSSLDLAPLEDEGGVVIHRVGPVGKGRSRKFAMIPGALREARALARDRDVLMNGGTRVLALPARLAVARTRCALVLRPELNGELDGSLALWGRESSAFERRTALALARTRNRLLGRAGAVVAISEAIAREAVVAGFDPVKVRRIPHGIDMATYAPPSPETKLELRRSLGWPETALVVTYTGRLIRGKGLEGLLSILPTLADFPDLLLVLVGSGAGQVISIEEQLRTEAESPRIRGKVVFTGRVDNVADYLRASDVFVFPTLDEALGMSIVEAQACGLPAVASRTGGVPDVVEDGVTGLLTVPGDERAMAAALRALLSDPARRRALGQAARSRAQETFSFETCVSRYADLFRALTPARGNT